MCLCGRLLITVVVCCSLADGPDGKFYMNWNIAEFLPDVCHEYFTKIIVDWISNVWNARVRARAERGGDGITPVKYRTGATQADDSELAVGDMEVRCACVAGDFLCSVQTCTVGALTLQSKQPW